MGAEDTLNNFAYKLGPEGLDQMLQQVQQDSVRAMVHNRKYDEIYDLMNSANDEALSGTKRELNTSFKDYGVTITEITITNVHLPKSIAKDLEQTTIYHNQDEYEKLSQIYKLLVIDNREKQLKEEQAMKEKLEQFEAGCKRRLAHEKAKLELILAETKKTISEIKEQENADVLKIQADSGLQVAEINAKKEVSLSSIKAQGQAQAEELKVLTRSFTVKSLADADKSVAEKKAEELQTISNAENTAAKLMVAKRTYDERMKQLTVIQALSDNKNVSISGKNADNMVAQLLSSGNQAAVLGVGNAKI